MTKGDAAKAGVGVGAVVAHTHLFVGPPQLLLARVEVLPQLVHRRLVLRQRDLHEVALRLVVLPLQLVVGPLLLLQELRDHLRGRLLHTSHHETHQLVVLLPQRLQLRLLLVLQPRLNGEEGGLGIELQVAVERRQSVVDPQLLRVEQLRLQVELGAL